MRGTLHLLPAAEFPLCQAALSTRRPWEARSWQRGFGVGLDELERLNAAVAEALDGRQLTREDFPRWRGIPSPARAARLLERLGEEVARVEVDGTAAHALAADVAGLAAAEAERLAAFSGAELELRWADPAQGGAATG